MGAVQQYIKGNRFYALDLMRGGAIFAILLVHRVHYTWDGMSSREVLRSNMQGWMLPLLILAIILFTMAGIFYFITGAVNAFSMYNRVASGRRTPFKAMVGGVTTGIALVVMNYVHRIFFANGFVTGPDGMEPEFPIGIITGFVQAGHSVPFRWSQVTEPGTLSLIGMVQIVVSLVLWFVLKGDRWKNPKQTNRLLFGLSFVVIVATPFIKMWLRPIYDTWYAEGYYLKTFFIGHICQEFGLFPSLSFGLIGAVIGLALARNETREVFLKRNNRIMGALIITGVALAAVSRRGTPLGKWTIGVSISMIELAMFVLLLVFLMRLYDLRKKPALDMYGYPAFNFRQFGMVALTVYTFEPLVAEILKRPIIAVAGHSWTGNLILVILFATLCVIVWNSSLHLWRRIEFRGSMEWLMAKILLMFSGKMTTKIEFSGLIRPVDPAEEAAGDAAEAVP